MVITMRLYRESSLRKKADEPTIRMLDLWRSLSKEILGVPIEVMIGNRREHPQLRSFQGELHTAAPHIVEGKPVLVLWVDSTNRVSPLIITHELGHWILKLQGFHSLIYQPDKHCNEEILLNSMAHHPPLYNLQRSVGHDPLQEINSRANHNIAVFSREKESPRRKDQIRNALMLADDIMNCSQEEEDELKKVLMNKHPRTMRFIKEIQIIALRHDLMDPEDNMKFSKAVVKKLKMGKEWYEANEVNELRKIVEKVS